MKKKEKKNVALYIRVSTREQDMEGYSLDSQTRTLTEYCSTHGFNVYKIYSDEGISAKDIKHRPGVIQLLADAKERKFEIILVWKLTRFSRSLANLIAVCEDLEKYGVMLVSYSEAFDCTTPAGRMVRNMLGSVAQFEREVIGENVYMGMLERACQGKRTCNEVLGYDIEGKDDLRINPKEAEYVRFCFESYLQYKNLSQVAELARRKGYKGKRGKFPTAYSVCVIITRPIYCGYNTFDGKLFKGNHTPLVTVNEFRRVQHLLKGQGKIYGRTRLIDLPHIPDSPPA